MDKPVGRIRLEARPAADAWHAATALLLYAVEPRSSVTVAVDTVGLKPGDIAGLMLFGEPWMWLGVTRTESGRAVVRFDAEGVETGRLDIQHRRVWLRATCDFAKRTAAFHFSADGRSFADIGEPATIGRGAAVLTNIRCSLFCYTTKERGEGGHADFDTFVVNSDPAAGRDAPR